MADIVSERPTNGRWSAEVRTQARDYYLAEYSLPAISEELGVPMPTLRYWQNKDGWASAKTALAQTVDSTNLDTMVDSLTRSRSQALNDYQNVQQIAREGLQNEDLRFRDKKQAVDAMMAGLKGESDLLNQSVSTQLILEIAKVLDDELTDPFLRQRIGTKLAAIGQLYGG